MAWVKIDDGIYDHPKFKRAGSDALALFIVLASYSARYRTDGFVEVTDARALGQRWLSVSGTTAALSALSREELLTKHEGGREGGRAVYEIHDYLIYNPSKAQLEAAEAARGGSVPSRARPQAPTAAPVGPRDARPMPHPTPPSPKVLESSPDGDDQSPGAREAPRQIDSNYRGKNRRTKNGDGDIHELIIATLLRVTGKRIDRDWAEKVRALLLDGRAGVSDPHKYVENAILGEGKPGERFLPISHPAYEYIPPGKAREWITAKESTANGQRPTATATADAGIEPGAAS